MEATASEVSALAESLSSLANRLKAPNGSEQAPSLTKSVILRAKQVIEQLQDPFDRLMDQVANSYVVGASLTLMKLGAFDAIPAHGSITLRDLASCCNAQESLIARLMRQLTCVNIFTEVKAGEWAHNRFSIGLSHHAGPFGPAFYEVVFDEMFPSMLTLHSYLHDFGSAVPTSYTYTPHAKHNDMLGKTFWEILDSDPRRVQTFNTCLQFFSGMHPVVAMFPFSKALKDGNSPRRPLLVDIGGGRGQAIRLFREGCADLQGECVLQDRPEVISDIKEEELQGITRMAHDFFTEQPVKNAQVYYIRRVMHDWMDNEASQILKQIIPAMAPDSRVLIADMVIPKQARSEDVHAVWLDLMMMTIGGKERTEMDWEKLAELSGLKLIKIWQEPKDYGPLCVVEYMLPDHLGATDGGQSHKAVQGNLAMTMDGACDMDVDYKNGQVSPPLHHIAASLPGTPGLRGQQQERRLKMTRDRDSNAGFGHKEQDVKIEEATSEQQPMSPRRVVEVGG